jgi:hypothetical protein
MSSTYTCGGLNDQALPGEGLNVYHLPGEGLNFKPLPDGGLNCLTPT